MKDELNRSYNSGGVVYVLKSALSRSAIQYTKNNFFAKRFYIHKKQKNPILFTYGFF